MDDKYWITGNGLGPKTNPCAEAPMSFADQCASFPCAEQTLDGGFLVPLHLTEEILRMFKPKDKAMTKFEYLEDMFLNIDHVESFWHDLVEITPELSKGDIYHVEVNIVLSSGNEIVIDELKFIADFLRATSGEANRGIDASKKTLGYYTQKALEYQRIVTENAEEKK